MNLDSKVDPNQLPVIGEVAAGLTLLAVENRIGMFRVGNRLLRRGASFALKVKGNSLIEAGILDGDFIIIRK